MNTLSLLFLTCRRLTYMERTIEAARRHFEEVEPDVKPIWMCFDNGSSPDVQDALSRMNWDCLILSRENLGIGPAMNRLVGCVRTPHILNLQDDWLLENPDRRRFVSSCMAIMSEHPKIAQVKLDTHHFLDFGDRQVYDGPFQSAAGAPFFVQNPKRLWGGFTFPPAVTRMDALWELGPFREDQPFRRGWAESEYSARFSQKFLCAKSPQMLMFRHIGEHASPGWTPTAPTGAPDTSGGKEQPAASSPPRESASQHGDAG